MPKTEADYPQIVLPLCLCLDQNLQNKSSFSQAIFLFFFRVLSLDLLWGKSGLSKPVRNPHLTSKGNLNISCALFLSYLLIVSYSTKYLPEYLFLPTVPLFSLLIHFI
ncbi:hypothetical protein AMECASPLE_014565 [Ameca splendens]|uniref:Uncharacterized protein n=1 Tax=Ameca splendens TaxID=208324 RepID=A0ABV0YDI6_9TELE